MQKWAKIKIYVILWKGQAFLQKLFNLTVSVESESEKLRMWLALWDSAETLQTMWPDWDRNTRSVSG